MSDEQIITSVVTREELPSVNKVIREFQCGYQQAKRCLLKAMVKKPKKVYTIDDF